MPINRLVNVRTHTRTTCANKRWNLLLFTADCIKDGESPMSLSYFFFLSFFVAFVVASALGDPTEGTISDYIKWRKAPHRLGSCAILLWLWCGRMGRLKFNSCTKMPIFSVLCVCTHFLYNNVSMYKQPTISIKFILPKRNCTDLFYPEPLFPFFFFAQ